MNSVTPCLRAAAGVNLTKLLQVYFKREAIVLESENNEVDQWINLRRLLHYRIQVQ